MKPIIRLDLFNPAITTVTATGPVTPTAGVDVSAVIGDWRVVCQVISQTAGKKYQVNLEGSAAGVATRTVHLIAGGAGSIGPTADKVYSVRRHELDAWIIGFVFGKLRCNLAELDAGSSLQLRCWVEWASAL
jgi:hypothetical protein